MRAAGRDAQRLPPALRAFHVGRCDGVQDGLHSVGPPALNPRRRPAVVPTAAPVRRTFRSRVGRVGYAASRATRFVPAHPRMIMPHALRGLACRILLLACVPSATASAQEPAFTHADTLRGSITPERAWWDVAFYDLHVRLDPADSTVRGWNGDHLPGDGPVSRDADRPADAAGDRQHRAGRPPARATGATATRSS